MFVLFVFFWVDAAAIGAPFEDLDLGQLLFLYSYLPQLLFP